ncbi:MAG TPA: cytochrome c-type biogenesis protein [Vicinamibacteria bacterium]|nr:cytochrome c-type biogenesis protein [Vicinamibacteria bacterium]
MRSMARLLLGALLLVPAGVAGQTPEALPLLSTETSDVARVVGPPRSQPLSGMALDAKTYQVGALLRCPVCQGLSVSDSPAGMAQNMKGQVRDLLAAGFDQEQILAYFERSYGEFVRLQPPLRGVNWLVWFGPLLGLLAGAAIVIGVLRKRASTVALEPEPGSELPGPDTLPDDPELRPYLLRVRELAYGWPGGASPEKEKA